MQTPKNDAGDPPAQLLINNRPDQGLKNRLPVIDPARARAANDLRHHRILLEMLQGFAHNCMVAAYNSRQGGITCVKQTQFRARPFFSSMRFPESLKKTRLIAGI